MQVWDYKRCTLRQDQNLKSKIENRKSKIEKIENRKRKRKSKTKTKTKIALSSDVRFNLGAFAERGCARSNLYTALVYFVAHVRTV
jgi:hypothetical protein